MHGVGSRAMSDEVPRTYRFPIARVWHPMGYMHPDFDKTALHVDSYVQQIEGMTVEKTRTVRDNVIAAATPRMPTVTNGVSGDLVVFDAVVTIHRRAQFSSDEGRSMRQLSTVLPDRVMAEAMEGE